MNTKHSLSYNVSVSAFMAFRNMTKEDSSRCSPRFFHSCQPGLKLGTNLAMLAGRPYSSERRFNRCQDKLLRYLWERGSQAPPARTQTQGQGQNQRQRRQSQISAGAQANATKKNLFRDPIHGGRAFRLKCGQRQGACRRVSQKEVVAASNAQF